LLLAAAATAALSLAMYGWRAADAAHAARIAATLPAAAAAAAAQSGPVPPPTAPLAAPLASSSGPPLPESWRAPPYSTEVLQAIDAVADLQDPAALDAVMELADMVTALNAEQRADAAPRF